MSNVKSFNVNGIDSSINLATSTEDGLMSSERYITIDNLSSRLSETVPLTNDYITVISDNTSSFNITDLNGNVAMKVDNTGVTARQFVISSSDGSTLKIIDEYITDEVDSKISKINNTLFSEYYDNEFAIIDASYNAGLILEDDGTVRFSGYISSPDREFVIVDDNGYIGMHLKNGMLYANICSSTMTPDYQIPDYFFTTINSCYSDTSGSIKRSYVPKLYIGRITNDNVLIGNGGKMLGLTKYYSDMPSANVSSTTISNILKGDSYETIHFQFPLYSVKNTTLVNKDIRLMCLGDSLTDAKIWTSFIGKMFQMDNIDYKKKTNTTTDAIVLKQIGIRTSSSTEFCNFTYRDTSVNFTDYNEGRSAYSAATYLRHATCFTWENVSYNSVTKNILYVAWRVLGLYEKYGVEYDESDEHRELIRTTCSGQYDISVNCIDGFVWNRYSSHLNYGNIEFDDATDEQKAAMLSYLDGTAAINILDNPENPFYSKDKMLETKDSSNCYAFDYATYYSRYKTHSDDGTELTKKGSSYVEDSYVCNPNYIVINLGTNDSIWAGGNDTNITNMLDDLFKIVELLKDSTGAKIILFQNAFPVTAFPELDIEYNIAYDSITEDTYYRLKNKYLIEKCGSLSNQISTGIFYCPSFFTQRSSCANIPYQDPVSDDTIGYIVTTEDVHPSTAGYADIGYEVYSMLCYLTTL